jgi:hypothetical protein
MSVQLMQSNSDLLISVCVSARILAIRLLYALALKIINERHSRSDCRVSDILLGGLHERQQLSSVTSEGV